MTGPTHETLFALSDPHGCLDVLEQALTAIDLSGDAHLYLLGDYIPHQTRWMGTDEFLKRSVEALRFVYDLQASMPEKVTVLPGNHELMLLDRESEGEFRLPSDLRRWMRSLPPYAQTERQIFVHAGVDEEAGEWWDFGSEDYYYTEKYPPSFGRFMKDVIAGHVGTWSMAKDKTFHRVFWDGQSHYYLDGSTGRSGCMPILRYDVSRDAYQQFLATAKGVSGPDPVEDLGALV